MRTGISRRISRRRQRYESNGNEKLQKIRFSGLSVTGKYTQRYRRAGKIRIQTAFVAYNTAPGRRKAEKCDVRRGIRIPFIANSAGVLIPRPYARGALHRRHGGIRRKAPDRTASYTPYARAEKAPVHPPEMGAHAGRPMHVRRKKLRRCADNRPFDAFHPENAVLRFGAQKKTQRRGQTLVCPFCSLSGGTLSRPSAKIHMEGMQKPAKPLKQAGSNGCKNRFYCKACPVLRLLCTKFPMHKRRTDKRLSSFFLPATASPRPKHHSPSRRTVWAGRDFGDASVTTSRSAAHNTQHKAS